MNSFTSIDDVQTCLAGQNYVCGRALATVVFLSLRLGRPLFLEGEAGVGKTEIAKALATGLGRRLIRLQCYEGLDASSAVYEWNFAEQMIAIRAAEASGGVDAVLAHHRAHRLAAVPPDRTCNSSARPGTRGLVRVRTPGWK